MAGNALSVIDCVRNPFFADENVDYDSEYVKNFIATPYSSLSTEEKCVEIGIVEHSEARYTLQKTMYVDIPANTFGLPLGARTSQVHIVFEIPADYSSTDFSGAYARSIITMCDYQYAGGGTGIVKYGNTSMRSSGFYFGWWDWALLITVNSPGRTHMSMYWT